MLRVLGQVPSPSDEGDDSDAVALGDDDENILANGSNWNGLPDQQ